ncbi:DUF4873 domain-containing protein [Amycolatopsis sp. NBC_01480]|uniref:DUF4873 domain-containing protein n=1 Tax=Amycolatopsis sp. NBC_01480 TaxID=2903562 RepID=UPI002E2B3454|nr:DUF4873 domain-containing protein [Amycolatopsis sp. NBC_01480]
MSEHDEDGYAGPATLVANGRELPIEVDLRGYFQPIDGYYHWYGRISATPAVTDLAGGKKTPCEIRIADRTAPGELSDPDPWGRYRVMGTSTPPFAVPTTLEDLNA